MAPALFSMVAGSFAGIRKTETESGVPQGSRRLRSKIPNSLDPFLQSKKQETQSVSKIAKSDRNKNVLNTKKRT